MPDFSTVSRPFLVEGRILMRYLLGSSPSRRMLTLYTRSLTSDPGSRVLRLPALVRAWPPLLRALEPLPGSAAGTGLFKERLHRAQLIIEAFPSGAVQIYDYFGDARHRILGRLLQTAVIEAVFLPSRWVWGIIWRW